MSNASAAFTAVEAIIKGDWDDYLSSVDLAIRERKRTLQDKTKPPPKTDAMVAHQVWVWMNGPGKPHWAIRGTGAII